ncbi:hypothetical protein CHUAL_002398 [Chamberlinius hualienensis]
MGTQQFCLKWNNHQLNMLSVFDHLLQSEAFVDVTLACEGSSLKAHKMVLSACSPYFQNLFMENPCQHPIVILKDIQYNDMKSIIDFMYKGEVNVSQEQLSALLKTADTLKVKGLAEVSGQVTQSPVPEASLQQQPQQPPSTQQQTPVPSKSPTPKRKRRQGAPASPSAINTNHSNSRSSSSTPQPIIQSAVSLSASASSSSSSSSSSLPKATHNDDSAGSSSDHRHHSKMKKVDDSNFDDVNDLVVPHLKEERLEEDSNDVDDLIMEASQEHIEIDTDPSIMPYSNDGMDQENVSPMRNDSYPHSVSIPSTSQSGSNAGGHYSSMDLQQNQPMKFMSNAASQSFWSDTDGSITSAEQELVTAENLFQNEEDTRFKLSEFMGQEHLDELDKIKTSGKLINNLMTSLFSQEELAVSSVTGKKSSRTLEAKKALDPCRANLVIGKPVVLRSLITNSLVKAWFPSNKRWPKSVSAKDSS